MFKLFRDYRLYQKFGQQEHHFQEQQQCDLQSLLQVNKHHNGNMRFPQVKAHGRYRPRL